MPITPLEGPGGGLFAGDVTAECVDIRSEGVTPTILQTVCGILYLNLWYFSTIIQILARLAKICFRKAFSLSLRKM